MKKRLYAVIITCVIMSMLCSCASTSNTNKSNITETTKITSTGSTPETDYNKAVELVSNRKTLEAMSIFMKIYDYKDSHQQYKKLMLNHRITTGNDFTAFVKDDGTVIALGRNNHGQLQVAGWKDITSVVSHQYGLVGLKKDGTVVATKDIDKYKWYAGAENVSEWSNITEVSAGMFHTVGLKADGTVVSTKYVGDISYNKGQYNVNSWNDIFAISAGDAHTIGLKSNGTVVACGDNNNGQCNVESWTDIIAISARGGYSMGLKKDGTVVAVGKGLLGNSLDVSNWNNVVSISAGGGNAVALKIDGTVLSTGSNNNGECNTSSWANMKCAIAGSSNTIGISENGVITAIGNASTGMLESNGYNIHTIEKTNDTDQSFELPNGFPKDVPLYKKTEIVKTNEQDGSLVVVFNTSASFDEAFKYYENYFNQRGGYIKQPYDKDLDMITAPLHNIKKSISVIVTVGVKEDNGKTPDKCAIVMLLQSGKSYETVANIR